MEYLCLGTIGLILAPWKFDVLKTSIFALKDIKCFKNIKFPHSNSQPLDPQQKHHCLISVQWLEHVYKMAMFFHVAKQVWMNILMKMDNYKIPEKTK